MEGEEKTGLMDVMSEDTKTEAGRRTGRVRVMPAPLAVQDPLSGRSRSRIARLALIGLGLVAGVGLLVYATHLLLEDLRHRQPESAGTVPHLPPVVAEMAMVRFEVSPDHAMVMVNGRPVADPAEGVEVGLGTHLVSIRADGFARVDSMLRVRAGGPLRFGVSLDAESEVQSIEASPIALPESGSESEGQGATSTTGSLTLRASVDGALVYADGRFLGRAPIRSAELEQGEYALRIEAPDHIVLERTVQVQAGQAVVLDEVLAPRMGQVRVLVLPWGSISIDGELMHEDSDVRRQYDVAAGMRRIRADHPVLGTIEREVRVQADDVLDVILDFSQQ